MRLRRSMQNIQPGFYLEPIGILSCKKCKILNTFNVLVICNNLFHMLFFRQCSLLLSCVVTFILLPLCYLIKYSTPVFNNMLYLMVVYYFITMIQLNYMFLYRLFIIIFIYYTYFAQNTTILFIYLNIVKYRIDKQ